MRIDQSRSRAANSFPPVISLSLLSASAWVDAEGTRVSGGIRSREPDAICCEVLLTHKKQPQLPSSLRCLQRVEDTPRRDRNGQIIFCAARNLLSPSGELYSCQSRPETFQEELSTMDRRLFAG